jgi:hypothetical protein
MVDGTNLSAPYKCNIILFFEFISVRLWYRTVCSTAIPSFWFPNNSIVNEPEAVWYFVLVETWAS